MVEWKGFGSPFLDFTEEITQKWIDKGFDKEQCKEWLESGLKLTDVILCDWLKNIKKTNAKEILNKDIEQLREEHKRYLENNTKETIDWKELIQNEPNIKGEIKKIDSFVTSFNLDCCSVISEKKNKFKLNLLVHKEVFGTRVHLIKIFSDLDLEKVKIRSESFKKELNGEHPILALGKETDEQILVSHVLKKLKVKKDINNSDDHIKKYDIIGIKMDKNPLELDLHHAVIYLGKNEHGKVEVAHISGSGNFFKDGGSKWRAQIDTWENFLQDHKQTKEMILYRSLVPFKQPGLIQKHIELVIAVAFGLNEYELLRNNCEYFATLCVTGVPFSPQADNFFLRLETRLIKDKIKESKKFFDNLEEELGKMDKQKIKNILLIGRTNSGKSAIANVLTSSGEFVESSSSVSETRNIQSQVFEHKGIEYRVIDTPGFGNAELSDVDVVNEIFKVYDKIKEHGLSQVLFVVNGKPAEEEERVYNILWSVIFDNKVTKHTTIISTDFPSFQDLEKCKNDEKEIFDKNKKFTKLIKSCGGHVYINNPPLNDDYDEKEIDISIRKRKESRKKLVNLLEACNETYKPENIENLITIESSVGILRDWLKTELDKINNISNLRRGLFAINGRRMDEKNLEKIGEKFREVQTEFRLIEKINQQAKELKDIKELVLQIHSIKSKLKELIGNAEEKIERDKHLVIKLLRDQENNSSSSKELKRTKHFLKMDLNDEEIQDLINEQEKLMKIEKELVDILLREKDDEIYVTRIEVPTNTKN